MTYLAGHVVLAVEAGAPNNGRGDATMGKVKRAWVAGRSHPYVSAQAFRRWLRDTMVELGAAPSPTERVGRAQGKAQKATTAADPIRYVDDDLFGYMRAGVKDGDKGTTLRDSPFMVGTLLSIGPARVTEDFGVMARGIDEPVLHGHEFYSADLAAPFLFDLPRIGTFTLGQQSGRPNYMKANEALAIAEKLQLGATEVTFRGQPAVQLPLGQRRERAALMLEAFATVAGGAKKALHYGDRTPAFVLLAPMAGGVNPFAFVLENADGRGLRVRGDVLAKELDAWSGEWLSPVRVGWRPGFREESRHEFEAALTDRIGGGHLVIDHPRTILTELAEEIRNGEHDGWFEEQVTARAPQ